MAGNAVRVDRAHHAMHVPIVARALLAEHGVHPPVPRHPVWFGENSNAAEVKRRSDQRATQSAEKRAARSRIVGLLKSPPVEWASHSGR
jgi:hypothetical protein